MKKFIAILAMVALVSGAAFAQVSGYAFGSFGVSGDEDSKFEDVGLGDGMGRINLEASAETEDGQFGVWMRFRGTYSTPEINGEWLPNVGVWGSVFWKPIDQVKFQIGTNPDNHMGGDNITRWGFYSRIGDMGLVSVENNYYNDWGVYSDNIFYGGFSNGGWGAVLTITPIPMLAINVGIPLAGLFSDYTEANNYEPYFGDGFHMTEITLENALKMSVFQVAATIPDVGKAVLTYEGIGSWNSEWDDDPADLKDEFTYSGKIYFAFFLTAIDDLGVDVGFSYDLDSEDIGLGLGFSFGAGDFGIKARAFFNITKDEADDSLINIGVDLLPSFAINENLTAFCSLGLYVVNTDNDIGFHLNPYIMKSAGWDKNFYAGVRLWQDPGKDTKLNWAIPVGIVASF